MKLILIGPVRYERDRSYLDRLQTLVDDLELQDCVEFKWNVSLKETQRYFTKASIGLHTRPYDTLPIGEWQTLLISNLIVVFASGLVEMMATNVIVIAHNTGAPKANLIQSGQNGFLGSDLDSYATQIHEILQMDANEQNRVRERAHQTVETLTTSMFEEMFLKQFDRCIHVQ